MSEPQASSSEQPRARSSAPLAWFLFALALIAGASLVFFGRELRRDSVESLARAHQANTDITARVRALEEERRELESRLASAEDARRQLAEARSTLEANLAQKDAQLEALQATYKDLDAKMKKEIASGDIRLSQSGGRIQVDLIDKVLFDSGEAALSARGQEVLSRLGASLAQIDDKQIQVAGHTDDAPIRDKLLETYATNWELSAARAVNVVRYLSESAQVPPARLVAAGYGAQRPIASNATPQGRARNRRIEIVLLPELALARVAAQKTTPSVAKPSPQKSVVKAAGAKTPAAKRAK